MRLEEEQEIINLKAFIDEVEKENFEKIKDGLIRKAHYTPTIPSLNNYEVVLNG